MADKTAEEIFNELNSAEESGDAVPPAGEDQMETAQAEAAEPAAEEATEPPAEPAPDESGQEPLSPEDAQRKASWEGRLKAREAELAAREAELKAKESIAGDEEEPVEEEQMEMTTGEEPGTGNPLDALREYVGDDVVEAIEALIDQRIQAAGGQLSSEFGAKQDEFAGAIGEAIKKLVAAYNAQHTDSIQAAHPDIEDIAKSPKFGEWMDGQSLDEQERLRAVFERGTWPKIVRELQGYKDWLGQQIAESHVDDGLNAVGVPSAAPVRPQAGMSGPMHAKSAEEIFNELSKLEA